MIAIIYLYLDGIDICLSDMVICINNCHPDQGRGAIDASLLSA